MISREAALLLVFETSKFRHSLIVSYLMATLAEQLNEDTELWLTVGLLHDLDYDETVDDRSRHGVEASERLTGQLPELALNAIRRHDYKSKFTPSTRLDQTLIFCDVVSIILESMNLNFPVPVQVFLNSMNQVSIEKPWVKTLIEEYPYLKEIDIAALLKA
jgi:hypothetical protein